MNRIIAVLVIVLNIQVSFSQSEWQWVSPNPPFKKVYSSSVVGNTAYFWCDANTVMQMNLITGNMKLLSIYTSPVENVGIDDFANQGIAFSDSLVGYITDLHYGEFRTTDGGLNWVQSVPPGSSNFVVIFGSNVRGWKLGGGFKRTDNAGASWYNLSAPFFENGSGVPSKMFAFDENKLWVLTKAHYYGNRGEMWFSSDGGSNFNKVNTGLISDSLNQVAYYDFRINPSGTGFATGTVYRDEENILEGFIQRTTDMGLSWTTLFFENERYKNILSINDNEWIILGNNGYFNESGIIQRRTTDAGTSWYLSYPIQDPLSNYTYCYNGVNSKSNNEIYLITSVGIYKSSDLGNTYTKQTSETDLIVNNIVFDNRPDNPETQLGIAWLKWNIKPYLLTIDGGQTWHQKLLPQEMGYIWLVGISENVIYMIVNQQSLYKSTDLGTTWTQLYLPIYGSGLQALNVYSKDCFVLNAYKNLVSSTDGGDTWILGPTIGNLYLRNSDISSPGKIVGVGSYFDSTGTKGAYFKSSDFGLSWHIIDTEMEVNDIQMLNDEIGIALEDNKIKRTSDSGDSWQTVRVRSGFTTMAFSDSLTGYVSEGYYFSKTTNGGLNWLNKDSRIPLYGVDKLAYNSNGDLFAIGGAVMLKLPVIKTMSPEVIQLHDNVGKEFILSQNYPNPFNPTTTLRFKIPEKNFVTIKVYDVLGNEVAILVNEAKPSGNYEIEFNGGILTSGIYFYQIKAGNFVETKKMILLK